MSKKRHQHAADKDKLAAIDITPNDLGMILAMLEFHIDHGIWDDTGERYSAKEVQAFWAKLSLIEEVVDTLLTNEVGLAKLFPQEQDEINADNFQPDYVG